MAYASQSDIQMAAGGEERLIQLADWDNDGIVDPAVIARAQDAADAFVNAYLRNRYTTPIAAPTPELVRLAADEAVYWMRSARNQTSEEDREMRRLRVTELEQARAGTLRFDDVSRSTRGRSTIIESDSDTTRDKLKGMW